METIGDILREAREQLGLTLEEAERSTHIRKMRLEALERGDFDSLPSRVQAFGFLRNYADYLGLDPDKLLHLFAQGEGGVPRSESRKGPKVRRRSNVGIGGTKPRRFRIYGDQIITGGVALAVIALLVWGTNRIVASLNQTPADATMETSSSVPLPEDDPSSTPQLAGLSAPPLQATLDLGPTLTATLPLGLVDSIEIELAADQSAYVQVLVDGQEKYQGRMQAGERLTFLGEDRVEVITGNARGLRIYLNGQDQGFLGDVNQVLTRVWTIRGMQTPTPTQTLTPTASPPVTATPTIAIPPVAQSTSGSG